MKLADALSGFYLALRADGYSQATIDLYRFMLTIFSEFLPDRELKSITFTDLTHYFAYLRTEYSPRRKVQSDKPISGSTLQNHWKAIRTFFRWAEGEGLVKDRPDARLKLPSNNPRVILPLTQDDIKNLYAVAEYCRSAAPLNRKAYKARRPTADRDMALIMLLLDTGIRAGEASRLNVADINLDRSEVFIAPYGYSRRKTKSRIVPLGRTATKFIWRHLHTWEAKPEDPVFRSLTGRRLAVGAIRCLFRDLGEKAGIKDCHPHRFRHTFAIEYLRNDGDIYTLQSIMGLSSWTMVRHYMELAQIDLANAHRKSSPVDKWQLN